MRWKGPGPLEGRMLEANSICKLLIRSSGLHKILWCLPKRKGNTWGMCLSWKQGKLLRPIWKKTATPLLHKRWIQPMKTTNIEHSWRNWSSWKQMIGQSFRSTWKKTTLGWILPSTSSATGWEWERFNVVVKKKTHTHIGSTAPTWTTPKSAKSPTKQLLHKSPIHPPKSIKNRLKKLSPIKPEQLKQKSQVPISQAGKILINTKVNNERPGSTFKMPSKTKLLIRIKLYNVQESTKPLQRSYSIESIDCDTDCIVTSLNLEVLNNYNTWNHLIVGSLINPHTFLNVNLLRIIPIYLNVCKQMTNVKLLLLHSNSRNHLTVCKQMRKSKWNDS